MWMELNLIGFRLHCTPCDWMKIGPVFIVKCIWVTLAVSYCLLK